MNWLAALFYNPTLYVIRFRDWYHGFDEKKMCSGIVSDPFLAYKFTRRELKHFPIGEPIRLDLAKPM